jgi:hypothetical protein
MPVSNSKPTALLADYAIAHGVQRNLPHPYLKVGNPLAALLSRIGQMRKTLA